MNSLSDAREFFGPETASSSEYSESSWKDQPRFLLVCKEVFNLKSSLSCGRSLSAKLCMLEQPRNQVSEIHIDKFIDPRMFQCGKTSFKTEVCSCSSFHTDTVVDQRRSNQWTILRRHSQLEGIDSRNLKCFMRR